MTVRSTRSSVTFAAPFRLPGFDAPLPAGSYAVDTEEEGIEGNDRTVFHRITTTHAEVTTGRVANRPEIGIATVYTPDTNENYICRLLPATKNKTKIKTPN